MTQPEDGFTPRKSEVQVHDDAVNARAKASAWDLHAVDPDDVTQRYSAKSGEVYERRVAADGEGYRSGLSPSDVRYQGTPHEQLISLVNDGVDPNDVDEKGTLVNDVGNLLKEMSTTLRQAVTKEQAGWQGAGADAAFTYLGNVAKWADSAGDAAYLTSNRFSQTSAAIATAQRTMPPPAGRSVTQSMQLANQQLTSGNFFDGLATLKDAPAQAAAQYAAQQEAARVVTSRDQTLYSAGSTQPVYAPPPPPTTPSATSAMSPTTSTSAHAATQAAAGPTANSARVTSPGPAASQPSAATHAASATNPAGWNPAAPPPGTGPGAGVAPGGSVGVSDQPERGRVSGVGAPGNVAWNPNAGVGDISTRSPGSVLDPGVAAGLVSGGAGTGTGDGERTGVGGRGTPNRSTGRPVTGAPGDGEPGGAAGKRVTSSEPGARAAAERAEAMLGKEGKAGANAVPGAAGRGKSDEDKEHKRPDYLVEADPDDALGFQIATDEHGNKIAPPVIGD